MSVKKSTRRFCNGSKSTRKTRENRCFFVEIERQKINTPVLQWFRKHAKNIKKSSKIIDFHRKTDGSKGEMSPWIFELPRVHLKKYIKFYRKNMKPKRSLLIHSVEYLWSENNFIFSILEQHDFTFLEYLWRKKKRKKMHFVPREAGLGAGAGLGWA